MLSTSLYYVSSMMKHGKGTGKPVSVFSECLTKELWGKKNIYICIYPCLITGYASYLLVISKGSL